MRAIIATLAAVLTFALSGCGAPPPLDVTGAISVPGGITAGGSEGGNYQPCITSGGYSDIRAGAQVVVTSAEGKVLAVSKLDKGALSVPSGASWGERSCVFSFRAQVPAGQDFYGVEVAHRGAVVYPAARMREHLVLSLGDR